MQKPPTVETEFTGNDFTAQAGAGVTGSMPRSPRRGFTNGGSASSRASSTETPLPQPEPVRDDLGPLVGRTFGGYEIVSYIGEGPSGAVYRGEDLLGNAMAVKVLHAGLANPQRTEQLRTELMRLSDLGHAQLQKIYDAGYGDDGQFFYVTDELVGCDLETGLEDSGGLAQRKSYEIIRAIGKALDVAHKAGVIHGGLRPRNVFLMPLDVNQLSQQDGSRGGRTAAVKVLDFGAARLGGGTDRGILAGLPAYLAPEQIDGNVVPQSDLFALGVLMYELFSGAMPVFRGRVPGRKGAGGIVAPPANVDPPLARLILSLLDSEPARRPPSAAAVLNELDRWAQSAQGLLDPLQPAVVRRRGPSVMSGSIGPDSTMRMSKFDAIALAQETLGSTMSQDSSASTQEDDMVQGPTSDDEKTTLSAHPKDPRAQETDEEELEALSAPRPTFTKEAITKDAVEASAPGAQGRKTMSQNQTPQGKSDPAPNASESVEASLEDFISQANASFPAAADGWDLHTGDVELIDDAETGQPVAKPRVVPQPVVSSAARPVTAQMPVQMQAPIPVHYEPPQQIERTEVVRTNTSSMPAQAAPASWTQNPLIVGAIVLGAVVIGMGSMFLFIKNMTPQPAAQPTIIVQQPAAAPAPANGTPVVTPLPAANTPPAANPAAAATAPVVTALPPTAPAAKPTADDALAALAAQAAAPTAPAKKAAKHDKVAAAPKAEPAPKKETAPAAKKETAPAAKKETPAKKESKKGSGSDWVDPFAN